MITFSPPKPPILSPSVMREPRVLTAKFGDGFSQRTGDGLNTLREMWSLVWIASHANITLIDDFFEDRAGVEAFLWIAPRDTVAKAWLCSKWQRTVIDRYTDRVSAEFERVFDLA